MTRSKSVHDACASKTFVRILRAMKKSSKHKDTSDASGSLKREVLLILIGCLGDFAVGAALLVLAKLM